MKHRKTNRPDTPSSHIKRNAKWLFRLFWGIGMSIMAYFAFSLFFDTPLEYEIKKSNSKLMSEYTTLEARYDSLQSVLDNIIERDKGIHRLLFESDPYVSWEDTISTSGTNNTRILNKSNTELGDEMLTRTGQLYQRVHNLSARMKRALEYIYENRSAANKIPAIQPIDNPDFSLLTASFGERIQPFYKTMKMHNGVDFSVPVGTIVFATADGVVTEINTTGQSTGLSIKIRHGNNYETRYANLGRAMVLPGQQVNRGDIIAFSGNSGMSFAPHLHYEVRHRGKPVDPIDYFFLEAELKDQEKLRRIAAAGMQSFD